MEPGLPQHEYQSCQKEVRKGLMGTREWLCEKTIQGRRITQIRILNHKGEEGCTKAHKVLSDYPANPVFQMTAIEINQQT
jgi:hypothetical protein